MFKIIGRFINGELLRVSRSWRRKRAAELLPWYMRQINGAGIRWEFEYMPYDQELSDRIAQLAAEHAKDLERFDKAMQGFDTMRRFLEACKDISVRLPHPHSYRANAPEMITRTVDQDMIDYMRQMYKALTAYIWALGRHDPKCVHGTIEKAAIAVAAVINPYEWRQAGYDAPDSVDGSRERALGIREYLEATISN